MRYRIFTPRSMMARRVGVVALFVACASCAVQTGALPRGSGAAPTAPAPTAPAVPAPAPIVGCTGVDWAVLGRNVSGEHVAWSELGADEAGERVLVEHRRALRHAAGIVLADEPLPGWPFAVARIGEEYVFACLVTRSDHRLETQIVTARGFLGSLRTITTLPRSHGGALASVVQQGALALPGADAPYAAQVVPGLVVRANGTTRSLPCVRHAAFASSEQLTAIDCEGHVLVSRDGGDTLSPLGVEEAGVALASHAEGLLVRVLARDGDALHWVRGTDGAAASVAERARPCRLDESLIDAVVAKEPALAPRFGQTFRRGLHVRRTPGTAALRAWRDGRVVARGSIPEGCTPSVPIHTAFCETDGARRLHVVKDDLTFEPVARVAADLQVSESDVAAWPPGFDPFHVPCVAADGERRRCWIDRDGAVAVRADDPAEQPCGATILADRGDHVEQIAIADGRVLRRAALPPRYRGATWHCTEDVALVSPTVTRSQRRREDATLPTHHLGDRGLVAGYPSSRGPGARRRPRVILIRFDLCQSRGFRCVTLRDDALPGRPRSVVVPRVPLATAPVEGLDLFCQAPPPCPMGKPADRTVRVHVDPEIDYWALELALDGSETCTRAIVDPRAPGDRLEAVGDGYAGRMTNPQGGSDVIWCGPDIYGFNSL